MIENHEIDDESLMEKLNAARAALDDMSPVEPLKMLDALLEFDEVFVELGISRVKSATGWSREDVLKALLTTPLASFPNVEYADPDELLKSMKRLKAINQVRNDVTTYYGIETVEEPSMDDLDD